MSNSILRDCMIVGALAIATMYGVKHRYELYELAGLDIAQSEKTPAQSEQSEAEKPAIKRGLMVSIPKSKRDGHFWTEARVNDGMVKFLVDTGASYVALTPEDARRAGIKLQDLDFNVPIATAGGNNVAAKVMLKNISIGAVSLRNVEALVIPEGLSTSLLGMTFLGQLQKVEASPNALTLKL